MIREIEIRPMTPSDRLWLYTKTKWLHQIPNYNIPISIGNSIFVILCQPAKWLRHRLLVDPCTNSNQNYPKQHAIRYYLLVVQVSCCRCILFFAFYIFALRNKPNCMYTTTRLAKNRQCTYFSLFSTTILATIRYKQKKPCKNHPPSHIDGSVDFPSFNVLLSVSGAQANKFLSPTVSW